MSRIPVSKSGARSVERDASLGRHEQRFLELKRGLEQIEYFCKGTVLKRMMKCGKAQCACASDATRRHGPYFELTYKANGKTVNVKLSPEAAPLYRAAAQQYRKLKTLLQRLDKLSKPSCATKPNWQRPSNKIDRKNSGYSDIPGLTIANHTPNGLNWLNL